MHAYHQSVNIYYCNSTDIQMPEFTDVPVNQTAPIGATVTFNCSVSGHPKPTITWMKENDSHSVQSSPRAEIITDVDKGLSQLVITGVTSEDYGKYQCVANNSAGVKESQVAFLYPGVEGKILLCSVFCTCLPSERQHLILQFHRYPDARVYGRPSEPDCAHWGHGNIQLFCQWSPQANNYMDERE